MRANNKPSIHLEKSKQLYENIEDDRPGHDARYKYKDVSKIADPNHSKSSNYSSKEIKENPAFLEWYNDNMIDYILHSLDSRQEQLNDAESDDRFQLKFDLTTPKGRKALTALSGTKLPPVESIRIDSEQEDIFAIGTFLLNSFPDDIQNFELYWDSDMPANIEELIKSLEKCIPNIESQFTIHGFQIDSDWFNRIIKASRNTEEIQILFSKIVVDKPLNFSQNLQYRTKTISFEWTGSQGDDYSNWKTNPEDLAKIFKAMHNSTLLNSLQKIDLKNCGLKLSNIKKLLQFDENRFLDIIEGVEYDGDISESVPLPLLD